MVLKADRTWCGGLRISEGRRPRKVELVVNLLAVPDDGHPRGGRLAGARVTRGVDGDVGGVPGRGWSRFVGRGVREPIDGSAVVRAGQRVPVRIQNLELVAALEVDAAVAAILLRSGGRCGGHPEFDVQC